MDISNSKYFGSIAAACLLLAACGGDSSNSDEDGRLSLSITDAPIYDAHKVDIKVIGVEVKPESGSALKFNVCKDEDMNVSIEEGGCPFRPGEITISLLQYTNGASFKLLNGVSLPAGRINWVRLMLAEPAGWFQLSEGSEYPLLQLTVPSEDQTGLKLNRGFDIVGGEETRVTIDFDVRKSIVEDATGFKLKPVLRLVEDFGAIAGTAVSLLEPECKGPSIYVFEGDTTPDDIDRDKGDPVSSAMVDGTDGSYRVDFLEPGEYTAAFVCAEGVLNESGTMLIEPAEDPDQDDALSFTPPGGKPATVNDDQTFELNFL